MAPVNDDLSERVEAITKVAQGDNPALFRYNTYQVQDLLSKLDWEDLSASEIDHLIDAAAAAYTRKTGHRPPEFVTPRQLAEWLIGPRIDYQDFTHTELVAFALALAEAYGRKLLGTPTPLRLISEWTHRSAAG